MEHPQIKLLRFNDLKAARIVTSWPQLKRLVDNHGFPAGYLLSPHTRVFDADSVETWLASRRAASAQRAPHETA